MSIEAIGLGLVIAGLLECALALVRRASQRRDADAACYFDDHVHRLISDDSYTDDDLAEPLPPLIVQRDPIPATSVAADAQRLSRALLPPSPFLNLPMPDAYLDAPALLQKITPASALKSLFELGGHGSELVAA